MVYRTMHSTATKKDRQKGEREKKEESWGRGNERATSVSDPRSRRKRNTNVSDPFEKSELFDFQ